MPERRVVAIIQARMGSSRLPGKVLLDIAGKPMLARVVERTRLAGCIMEAAVATTTEPADDALEAYCLSSGIPVLRGSAYDVLDRYYQAARQLKADVVVRITADCPVIDPGVIDLVVQDLLASGADFAANRLPPPYRRTFPIGLDTEACTFAALEKAWREASLPYQREHVLPYLYDTPGRFRIRVLDAEADYGSLRWTVDTPADLEVLRRIYAHFAPRGDFGWKELLAYYLAEPELQALNAGVVHKSMTDIDDRSGSGGAG